MRRGVKKEPDVRVTPAMRHLMRYAGALAIVAGASVLADVFSRITGTSRLTSIFLSSVLLAAFYLGTGPGYLAAGAALVAHLYLVDPPYQFSLGSIDEMNALLLFLAASVLTNLLAGRVRDERRKARARAEMNAALLDAAREFSATADEAFIRERLAERLGRLAGGPAVVRAEPPTAEESAEGWRFRTLTAGEEAFGVAGWRSPKGRPLEREAQAALELLTDTGAAAIARARLDAAKAEAETRARTEDLRNALLSSVSHDLRTPLATILGSATTLKRFADSFDAETRRDLATTIEEEASRLDAFVSNLLQMTRLQAGAAPLKRVAFGAPEAVRATVERRTRGRPGTCEVRVEPGLPDALGDPALFEQALGNVVDNALRYASCGGPVDVDVRRRGGALVVAVSDRGPGVAEGDLERIFERFFRAAGSERISGTGLGLSISRGLMEGMDGQVSAQAREGGGLSVELTLPAAAA
jgi:two-component system sensor histidine kinase KdpD